MNVTFIDRDDALAGVVVLPIASDGALLSRGQAVDKALSGALSRAIKQQPRFSGKKEEVLSVNGLTDTDMTHGVLLGIGDAEKLTSADYRSLGGAAAAHLQAAGYESASIDATDIAAENAAQFAFGLVSRLYRFDRYRTTQKPEQKMALTQVNIQVADKSAVEKLWPSFEALTRGITLARDLVSDPPNKVYPATFVDKVKTACADLPLTIRTLNQTQMQELGMGALLAVNQGSAREPFTLIVEYKGLPENPDFPLAIVGKGVTFDTGGLCIKQGMPPGGWPMSDMKFDMAGGAAVVGAMLALAGRNAEVNVVGLVGLVENTIDATAFLPADIVNSMSGQTIEVLNTDAEGRMVLADVLWYAQENYKLETVIDIATLTGAVIAGLSDQYAGLFTDSDTLTDTLVAAGKETGERVWPMPLGAALDKHLDSPIADMANMGSGGAGASVAALFIKRFVKKDLQWAHIDMAGMAWTKTAAGILPGGATGYGVALLNDFVSRYFEKKTTDAV